MEWFFQLDITNKINFSLALVTALVAVASIVIVIVTIRQNSMMIKASTRAYVSIQVVTSYDLAFLLLKNYGNTSAVITYFKVDKDLSKYCFNTSHTPFENAIGTHLAPQESILSSIKTFDLFSAESELTFDISYRCNKELYSEKITINLKSLCDHFTSRRSVNDDNSDVQTAKALQDIHEALLKG